MSESSKVDVSIVVPAYKSAKTIGACLEALLAQRTDLSYEVIVVESSSDGAAELVRKRFPQIRVIESDKRLLSGAARNLGAAEASGEILCFVDSDCNVEADWISKMWKVHKSEGCAAVGGGILNGNLQFSVSVSSYLNEFSDFYCFGRIRPVRYLSSCHVSYKADVFRGYGGFPPEEPLYVDLIFNTSLTKAGERLLFVPEIRGAHMHRTSLRTYLRHEMSRGRAAAVARRKGLLIGASWGKSPVLAILATPGLFARKATVFPYRFLRAYPREILRLLKALPYFYLALVIWHYGFLKEVMSAENIMDKEGAAECANN